MNPHTHTQKHFYNASGSWLKIIFNIWTIAGNTYMKQYAFLSKILLQETFKISVERQLLNVSKILLFK